MSFRFLSHSSITENAVRISQMSLIAPACAHPAFIPTLSPEGLSTHSLQIRSSPQRWDESHCQRTQMPIIKYLLPSLFRQDGILSPAGSSSWAVTPFSRTRAWSLPLPGLWGHLPSMRWRNKLRSRVNYAIERHFYFTSAGEHPPSLLQRLDAMLLCCLYLYS